MGKRSREVGISGDDSECDETWFAGDYSEAGAIFDSALSSKNAGTWMNRCWINDSKLDEMIDDALTTLDTDERVAKYEAIQDYLADKCVMIPMAEVTLRLAYQPTMWNTIQRILRI